MYRRDFNAASMLKMIFGAMMPLAILLFAVSSAFAQFETASLVGRVADTSGAVIAGAEVSATNIDTNTFIFRVTNKDGEYTLPALSPGHYRISASAAGFRNTTIDNVQLEIGTSQRVDITLSIAAAETISVSDNELNLETETSQKQQVVTGEQVEAFPLLNMDYTDLLTLSSGVTQDAAGQDLGTSSVVREGSYNINGLRPTYNNYMLDGLDNNAHGTSNQGFSNQVINPSQYNITQFSIVTAMPSAEYGHAAGGTINAAFKQGTDKYHGTIYESFRNTILDANGYFKAAANSGASTRTTLNRNQFGGNAGGPILHNRFFFFADYEGLRETRQVVNQSNIFDASAHQLIVSPNAGSNTTTVEDPFTGVTYPSDRPLPRAILSPIALAILDAYPLPNNNGAGSGSISSNWSVLQRFDNSVDKEDIRLDGQFSPRTEGFVRLSQSKEHDLDGPTLPAPIYGDTAGYIWILNQQLALGLNRQIGASQLLEARLGISFTKAGKQPFQLGEQNTFNVSGLPTNSQVWGGLTSLAIDGYTDIGRQSTNPQWQNPFYLNPKLSYSWLFGRHNVKAGYEFSYLQQTIQDVNPIYGEMDFESSFTGYVLSDFLFGVPNEIDLTNYYVAHVRQGGHSAYVQDDWKVLHNLTLNMGVRYEYASHFYDKEGNLSNFDPVITPQTGQLLRASTSGSAYSRQLVRPVLDDFMPRFGLAYSPFSRMVVHAGYGIGYMHYTRSGEDDNLAINAPQVNQAVFNQVPKYFKTSLGLKSSPTFYSLDNGYPEGMSSPANFNLNTSAVKWIPSNYRDPYVQSWYVGFQSRITKTMLFDLGYVGNHALKMQEVGDYNQRSPSLGVDPVTGFFQRPDTAIGDVLETFNGGFSKYNGLQARFQEQGFHGLWLLNAFTWSRDFGNVSDPLSATHGFSGSPQDYYNLKGDYGPVQYDTPIVNVTAMIWSLPVGRGKLLWRNAGHKLDEIIGGWQLTAYNQYHSGPSLTPNFTPTGEQELSNSGGVMYRPFVPNWQLAKKRLHISGHPEEAFCDSVYDNPAEASYNGCTLGFSTTNPNPVAAPISDTADWSNTIEDPRGNANNGMLRGDSFWELDAGMNKKFSLPWEHASAEIRTEFYNVLNKTNFTAPGMTCCSTSFGRITSTYGPGRVGQFQARVWF